MPSRHWLSSSSLVLGGLCACVPDFDDRTSQVSAPRVLAIRALPAEAAKGQTVELSALIAAADSDPAVELGWSLCVDRKPLSELGPVSAGCLEATAPSTVAVPLGSGPSAQVTLPAKVCQLFGPERPDPKAGEPAGRPVDPDPTGGFYQPVLTWLGGSATLGGIRLACPLSGATREGTVEYNRRYRPNRNPELVALEVMRADGSTIELQEDEGQAVALAPGERVTLSARFAECPLDDQCGDGVCGQSEEPSSCLDDCRTLQGCAGAERYAFYDRETAQVIERQESLLVTWFSSAGTLAEERSDRSATDAVPAAVNAYVAPSQATAEARLWAVIRDDRGGVSWRTAHFRIE